MSFPSQIADEPRDSSILVPYHGSKAAGTRRWLKRLQWPVLIVGCLFYGMAFAFLMPYLVVMIAMPVVILSFIVIWALPDTDSAPTRSMIFLYFAFFASLIVWPSYLGVAVPGLPWVTPQRLTVIPMTLLLLICISMSKDFRSRLAGALSATPAVWRLLVAFVVVQFVTVAFSKHPLESFQKVILSQIYGTAIFFASCYIFLKRGRVQTWAALFCLLAVPVSLIAFRENHIGKVIWADHLPSFLRIEDPIVSSVLSGITRDVFGSHRTQSIFPTSLGLAEYVALMLPFVLHFILSRQTILVRLVAIIAVPLLILVVLYTDARLGLIGALLDGLLYLFIFGVSLWRRHRDGIIGPAIVIGYPAFFALAVASTLFVGRIRERIFGSGQYDASTAGRTDQYTRGIPMALGHFWGYGAGMGGGQLNSRSPSGFLSIDTYYLLMALDYGILGFILFYSFLILSIYYGVRYLINHDLYADKDYSFMIPATVSLITFLVIKSVFSEDGNHPFIYMMIGMVVALVYRIRNDPAFASDVPAYDRAQRPLPRIDREPRTI